MNADPGVPVGRQVSEEEFYDEQDEDSPYQYLGGELVVREPVSYRHEYVSSFLKALLRIALEERGGGIALGGPYPMRLDPKWSPEPDVMVVLDGRRHLLGPQRLEGPADMVIEVASPGDVDRALRLKLPRYREARIPEIWVVDPYARSLRVESLDATVAGAGGGYSIREVTAGRLHPAVLPWFWIDVSWLWREPLPPTLACLRQILG